MGYPIPNLAPGQHHACETEVEKSRFIAWVCHASDTAAFARLLDDARRTHPHASHHCSAFIAGPPGEQQAIGFSDDGEPGGTAGRPMFQVLDGAGVGQIGCVVIRYFGGTKLGTGGLARAYANSVAQALTTLPLRDFVPRRTLRLQVDFAGEAEARGWLAEQAVPVTAADYDSDGVVLTAEWPVDDDERRLTALSSRLRGRLTRLD